MLPSPRGSLAAVLALLLLVAQTAFAANVPTDFVDETVVPGLALPRAFDFLPDGRALIVEQKSAKVRLVVNGQLATPDPILTLPGVNTIGYERGLQGVAVDPQWPARPFVYFFHNATGGTNRLVRYTASGALTDSASGNLVLGTPRHIINNIPDVDANHQAGCLKFGPDGMLYVSLGEDEQPCTAQDSTSLRGQILRVDVSRLDGSGSTAQALRAAITPQSGNPLATADSNARLVWAYGFRNPYMFSIDAATGLLHVADVGEADEEELDEVVAGANYGWPYREGATTVLPRIECPEPGGAGNGSNGYRVPIVAYPRNTELHAMATSGVYRPSLEPWASNWPPPYWGMQFWGDFYFGELTRIFKSVSGSWQAAPAVPGQPAANFWGTGFLTPTDFRVGRDGALYWTQLSASTFGAGDGSLRRVRYTGPRLGTGGVATGRLTLAASPNPFRVGSVLAFHLPRAAEVRLSIHDLAGRRVRSLARGWFEAGAQTLAWTGDDDRGNALPAGVYLARLEAGDAPAVTQRLFRVR